MKFEESPYEWSAPARKWWFWPVVILRGIWVGLITIVLIFPVVFVRLSRKVLGHRRAEYWFLKLWGRLSWLGFAVNPTIHGKPMNGDGTVVANHASWLDIPVLIGATGGYMVSKAEVGTWPVIGQISRLIGTVFVDRKRASSRIQADSLQKRLEKGDRLMFFPEGTSTDALRVVKFRSTLFAAMVEADPEGFVQPVSIVYHAPKDASVNFFGWWASMPLTSHLLGILGQSRRADVDIVFHAPIKIGTDRKALCAACQAAVEAGFREFADKIVA